MAKRTINDYSFAGKKVLMRCDFNVPLNENLEITDDRRIESSLPSINKVLKDGAGLVLCSHLGRPKGQAKPEFSLKPVAKKLSELLGKSVVLAPDCVGSEVNKIKKDLKPGQVVLLENLRFHNEEEKNDPDFAKQLAQGFDVFVNDAFGTAHRAHASTEGVTRYINESLAGFLIEKELKYLGEAIETPARPLLAILGGAKISGKIDVIKSLFDKVDLLIIGGGMTYTFFKSMGMEIGTSLLEADRVDMAGELLKEAKKRSVEILLPVDLVIADKFDNDAKTRVVPINKIPADWMALDIGPETIKIFGDKIKTSKTIVWNGPMGAFEMPTFSVGTRKVAESMVAATKKGATTVIGGGDSAAAVTQFGLDEGITHISTGGGASLEYLEGKILPGIEALTEK